MIDYFRFKWREIHISKDIIKINNNYRFDKRKYQLVNIKNRVPNLILVGSQKCGTTSLYNYLSNHEDICVTSPFKESGYFMFEAWAKSYWKKRSFEISSKKELLNKYMNGNLAWHKYFCDASTYYTQDRNELRYQLPKKIALESPDAKILYIIRNPFARITSNFYHAKNSRNFDKNIDKFINNWVIDTTLYYDRIKSYIDEFGKTNVYILQMEDLKKNPQSVMNGVFDFLDLGRVEIKSFDIFNKTSPDVKEKFSLQTFTMLHPIFEKQQKLLKKQLGLNINWNLDKELWVCKNERL